MKTKISVLRIATAVVLIVSLAANVYFLLPPNRRPRSITSPPDSYRHLKCVYPMKGLSNTDVLEILAVFDSLDKKESWNQRIRGIILFDDTHVVIETGFQEHPLSGGGRFWGFIKTANGWIYDTSTKSHVWIS